MLSNGFHINKGGKCVYVKIIENSCVILCLYVDDILIFGSNIHVIYETKRFWSNNFYMKDLVWVDVILGIKVIRSNGVIALTQSHYIEKLLKKFNVSPVSIPLDLGVKGAGVS